MFNATSLRLRAKHPTRLDSYFKRQNFVAITRGLMADGVPEDQIMSSTKGPTGCTMLHDAFFIDFMAWIGGEPYYRAVRQFVAYPKPPVQPEGTPQ